MKELYEYLEIIFYLSPLFFFIIAVTFRLLDNSAHLFLKQEIIIESSYVSMHILKQQVEISTDERFKRKLRQVLLFRKLHRIFLVLMLLFLPVSFWFILS